MKRGKRRTVRSSVIIALACFSLGAGSACACDIPVYRWALENWRPDAYDLLVYHQGPLPTEVRALLDGLKAAGEAPPEGASRQAHPNLTVRMIDIDAPMDERSRTAWESQRAPALPWMVLRYPYAPPQWPDAWAGPLNEANLEALLDSPKRREIARLIAENNTAIWVFLGIGDPEKDVPALTLIRRELAGMPEALRELPAMAGLERSGAPDPTRGVAFTVVQVDRADPAERVLTAMLLGTESDLRTYDEPMVFPVFGCGRVLYSILGAGITRGNILEACAFMFGACTCLVKEQNPGTDLLMTADWRAILEALPDLDAVAAVPRQAGDAFSTPFQDELPGDRAPIMLFLAAVSLGAALLALTTTTLVLVWRSRRRSS